MRFFKKKENEKYELLKDSFYENVSPYIDRHPVELGIQCEPSTEPSGSSVLCFGEFLPSSGTDEYAFFHLPKVVESLGCKWCGIRLFPEDRWCPACGAPIFA